MVKGKKILKLKANDKGSSTTQKRKSRHCPFCRNHKRDVASNRNHQCLYKIECLCPLCKITRSQQKVMKHQQRIWRFQKQKLKVIQNTRTQKCDKCRNHSIIVNKGKHVNCPYSDCTCEFCGLSNKRRAIAKHFQKPRRLGITMKSTCIKEEFGDDPETPSESVKDDEVNMSSSCTIKQLSKRKLFEEIDVKLPSKSLRNKNGDQISVNFKRNAGNRNSPQMTGRITQPITLPLYVSKGGPLCHFEDDFIRFCHSLSFAVHEPSCFPPSLASFSLHRGRQMIHKPVAIRGCFQGFSSSS